ncbi:holo-ACP synthase [Bacillus alveayuensis]|jgi:holo-[acyl-carrier protein] synthase|uniref:Holo-[acyl-carrier-protein] synthase n=1 Tax=Aeribacillus alveayuensis TaxID=279215 RepID=A0ABT9VR67_9BACI|nr:holo-ACP synthase [Bacillus alveayuensis]MDQ0163476.1 holo-[acyl-carrier protein] synthase [Bacillus alveayuensis]
MITGIGLDIVELNRIGNIVKRNPKFIDRILTAGEKERFVQLSAKRRLEFLAGRFAAKEAFSKAIGTGIGKKLSFLDIEILNDEKGKPVLIQEKIKDKVHVTITHSQQFAVAQVIVERIES